jgi:integrase/recombinase XerD
VVTVIIRLFFLAIWRKEAEMTMDRSLPEICRSGAIFFPPFDSPRISSLSYRAQFTYRDCPDEGGSFTEVLQEVARLEFSGRVQVYRYLLEKKRRNCRISTLFGALTYLRAFFSFLKGIGKTRVEDVTRRDLEAFVEHLQDRGRKLATVRNYLAGVYTFLQFLSDEGIVSAEILQRKIWLRLPQILPKAMIPDDVKRFLSVIDDLRDRALILVLLRTGMRVGELLKTKLSDVNLKECTITIREGRKSCRGRVVYFSDDAREALAAWLRERDARKAYLLYPAWGDRMPYGSARWVFRKHLRAAGLADKGYTLHCLRHTYAVELLNAGMRLECLQQLLGHESIFAAPKELARSALRLSTSSLRPGCPSVSRTYFWLVRAVRIRQD